MSTPVCDYCEEKKQVVEMFVESPWYDYEFVTIHVCQGCIEEYRLLDKGTIVGDK